jgi:hypothetical protein
MLIYTMKLIPNQTPENTSYFEFDLPHGQWQKSKSREGMGLPAGHGPASAQTAPFG